MEPTSTAGQTRTIALASGKGGVGKTVITANLSLALAQLLEESKAPVVAVDLDLGCGNLNACLGVRSPNGTVNEFLRGSVPVLDLVLSATEQPNLKMICSSYSGQAEMHLGDDRKQALLNAFHDLTASYVLMDLGAGTSADVLDLFLGADQRIVVITPEAFSLHNAFVFLKTALLRLITRELADESVPLAIREGWHTIAQRPERFQLQDAIRQMQAQHRYGGCLLQTLIGQLEVELIVNRYHGGPEESYLINFYGLLAKHLALGRSVRGLGFVHFDSGIPKAVQGVSPFLLGYPDNLAAVDLRAIANRLYQEEDRHCFDFPKETVPVEAVSGPAAVSWSDQNNPNTTPVSSRFGQPHAVETSCPDPPSPSEGGTDDAGSQPPPNRSQHRKGKFSQDILEVARRLTQGM